MTREIVFAGKSYLAWLPFQDKTIKRARLYFDGMEPFEVLDTQEKQSLKQYHIVRNALAHKSQKAQNAFQNIISSLPLLPREKRPNGYLRSQPSSISTQTQFEIMAIDLAVISRKLCS